MDKFPRYHLHVYEPYWRWLPFRKWRLTYEVDSVSGLYLSNLVKKGWCTSFSSFDVYLDADQVKVDYQ